MSDAHDHPGEATMNEGRRRDDALIEVIASRLDVMHKDMGEMKSGMTRLADAISKLAVVEERQSNDRQAIERAFKSIERLDARIDGFNTANMESCRAMESRIDKLEIAAPEAKRTTDWVMTAVWGALGLLGMFLGPRILERVFQ